MGSVLAHSASFPTAGSGQAGQAHAPQEMVTWNHGLADVIGALLRHGLRLEHFAEHDYSPYAIYGERGVEVAPGRWMIDGLERKLPLVYALVVTR